MSMAAELSDLADETSGVKLQTEGHMDVPSQSAKVEASDSSLSHLPSCSPAQRPLSGHPNMKHCLEIHVTLTEELAAIPPPSHSWMAPLMEDMLHDARTRLTKAVVTGPGRAVLSYGRHSMEEGLIVDNTRDATFLFTGGGTWVGKAAYLTADPLTIQEGRRAIAQAISDCQIKARGPGCLHVNLPAQQPFQFDSPRSSPLKDVSGDGGSCHPPSPHQPSRGQEHNRCWTDQRSPPPRSPSPSPDHGFESDWSLLLTASSMSSRSGPVRWIQMFQMR